MADILCGGVDKMYTYDTLVGKGTGPSSGQGSAAKDVKGTKTQAKAQDATGGAAAAQGTRVDMGLLLLGALACVLLGVALTLLGRRLLPYAYKPFE